MKKFFSKYKKEFVFYFCVFLAFIILNRAKLLGLGNPFAFGFLFSLVYLKKNALILAPLYLISYIIYNPTFSGFIISVSTISLCVLLYLSFKIIKKPINFVCTLVFALLSQAGFVYYNISSPIEVFATLGIIAVGLVFVYVSQQAVGALLNRGFQCRFSIDENICFSILLMAVFSGLEGIYFFNISITNIFVFLSILTISRIMPKFICVCFSILSGVGIALSNGGISLIAVYSMWGVVSCLFNDKHKAFSVFGVVVTDLLFGVFFNVYVYYSLWNVLSMVLFGCVFLCIPQRFFDYIKGLTFNYEGKILNEYIIQGQKEVLRQKIYNLSELFKNMHITYRNLSIGEIDKNAACEVLAEELIKKHCSGCLQYNNCFENKKMKESIIQLFKFGLEKKKITIIDASNFITTNCLGLGAIINEVNSSIRNYFEYEKTIKTTDTSKMLISEHLEGMSDVLKEVSFSIVGEEKINRKLSYVLKNELIINNIIANEVLVFEGENGVEKIILVVKHGDCLSSNISLSIRSVLGFDFIIKQTKNSKYAGWLIQVYEPTPKYNLNLGFASSSKEENAVSGDVYSFTKINNNKALFAIADGMGHGEDARQISSMALSLIEDFYKAGFTSQTIFSSVNKLILPSNKDNFSTIDACVVDVSNGTADFIKIGSSVSVIKGKKESRLIDVNSLPLGVVDNIIPDVKKYVLNVGDIIVLVSDGVVDCFESVDDFYNFINNEMVVNAQMLADSILEEAQSRSFEHNDDKTVVTIKLNENLKTN